MKRLSCCVFTLCSAVSLVLCVVVCTFWLRSYWRADFIDCSYGDRAGGRYVRLHAQSRVGVIEVCRTAYGIPPERAAEFERERFYRFYRPSWTWEVNDPREYNPPSPLRRLLTGGATVGATSVTVRGRPPYPIRTDENALGVPHWVLATAAGALPATRFRRRCRARRRRAKGLCPGCGYDLRASPERCPECGESVGASCSASGSDKVCSAPIF